MAGKRSHVRPNLFIVGAPKCGTSSMHAYLQTHPRVYMSKIKEPHYFCTDFPGLRRYTSEAAYLQLFARVERQNVVVGEATSRYLYSAVAIQHIREFAPDARVVAMLRNPVDLVYSFHSQLLYQFTEIEPEFEKAWRLQFQREQGAALPPACVAPSELLYGRVGLLGAQVERLLDTFPWRQVKLIFYDDFRRSPANVYQNVLAFLDLPPDQRASFPTINPNKTYRAPRIARLAADPPYPLNAVKRALKQVLGLNESAIGRWVYRQLTVPTKRPPMPARLREELTDFFRDDIVKLQRIVSRDLSGWLSPPGEKNEATTRAA